MRICIVGGGIAGLATAIALRRVGFRATILEQAKEIQQIGAGIQIQPNAARILRRWDLSSALVERSATPKDILIRSWRDGKILSKQNLVPFTQRFYDAPFWVLHRADLHRVLLREAKRLDVPIELDKRVVAVYPEDPSVSLESGEKIYADAMLGCDGEGSVCRDAVSQGFPRMAITSSDQVFRIILKLSDIKQHSKLKDLTRDDSINTWWGPHSHVVSYSLPQHGSFNIVLTRKSHVRDGIRRPQVVPLADVMATFCKWDGNVRAMIEKAKTCSSWMLQERDVVRCWVHPEGKMALVGDAAHPMLPYLGQGAAQAIEDAEAIAQAFTRYRGQTDPIHALLAYQKKRSKRATEIQTRSSEMKTIHGLPDGPLQEERDWKLREKPPFGGFPNPWSDPVFQKRLWGLT